MSALVSQGKDSAGARQGATFLGLYLPYPYLLNDPLKFGGPVDSVLSQPSDQEGLLIGDSLPPSSPVFFYKELAFP
jgi:hypothetical protein